MLGKTKINPKLTKTYSVSFSTLDPVRNELKVQTMFRFALGLPDVVVALILSFTDMYLYPPLFRNDTAVLCSIGESLDDKCLPTDEFTITVVCPPHRRNRIIHDWLAVE
jgi:hypothetical protein